MGDDPRDRTGEAAGNGGADLPEGSPGTSEDAITAAPLIATAEPDTLHLV